MVGDIMTELAQRITYAIAILTGAAMEIERHTCKARPPPYEYNHTESNLITIDFTKPDDGNDGDDVT